MIDRKTNKSKTTFQIISISFIFVILFGTLLLMLPISSQDRQWTSFTDALFTAVSTTCVTGLIVKDTATYWSVFGKCVIITLIQIGGLGVITVVLAFMKLFGKKVGLLQRSIMKESISASQVGGIMQFVMFMLKTSLIIEGIGTILLLPVFCKEFGVVGIFYAVFHSISAFCNAGFDLMGIKQPFSSLCYFSSDLYLNIIIMLLIITGGLGFVVWNDIIKFKYHIHKYSLHSKVVLCTTLFLIFVPALFFYCCEYVDLGLVERVASSLFQSVTARTAGFNTQDLAEMSGSSISFMIILMLIGGSPGSTAGGLKTTTIAVMFLSALTVFSRRNDVECFKRRIDDDTVRDAGAIMFLYFILFFVSGMILSLIEGLPLNICLFETASALGTAGLTLGITTSLSLISKLILISLMFFGRVGGLTLIYSTFTSKENIKSKLPLEKINVG